MYNPFFDDYDIEDILAIILIKQSKEGTHIMSENTNNISNNVGLDIGTMNLVAARQTQNNTINIKNFRNVFLKVDSDSLGTRDISSISHVKLDDSIYFLSEDAYTFANIFSQQVSRPMSRGMISDSEFDSIDILGVMISALVGNASSPNDICCFSIPAEPIDKTMSVVFHKNVFDRILSQLGYTPLPLYEAVSLIYSECSNTDFSGIGISFGAGMTNIAIVFKGIQIKNFSLARGGDWIDENVSNHISGLVVNRVTLVKEKSDFDIFNFTIGDKKERRIREALSYYYVDLINYTVDNIVKELSKLDVDFPNSLPIVISGGTSKANGFLDCFKKEFNKHSLPFNISEIKQATNPLNAVAEGCLIRSLKENK